MSEVDSVAAMNAYKGLLICFIITITTANCVLILKTIKKGRIIYTPKSLVLISLAIGDIFLALFGLVVLARVLFELSDGLNCSTQKAFMSYVFFLIHFVYGTGLLVLAFEFVQRNRTPQQVGTATNNIVKSVVYSAFPWIIGLIIILPLTMADVYIYGYAYDTEVCEFAPLPSRLNAMYVVSVILPAIVAVLVCIAIMCIKLSPSLQSSSPSGVTYQVPVQTVATTNHYTNVGTAAGPPQYPDGLQSYPTNGTQGQQVYPINGVSGTPQTQVVIPNDKPGSNNGQQIFTTPIAQYPAQQYAGQQYPGQQYPVQQHPGQQYPIQQYPTQQYPTPQYAVQYPPPQFPAQQQYTTQSNVVFTTPTNLIQQQNTTTPIDPGKERTVLLIAAIMYFICVVPYASLVIGTLETVSLDSSDSYTIASVCLFGLSISRSLLTPIMFIITN